MRIEAGKYYRTRDGRKVGPMSRCGVGSWPWGVDGDCEHWDDYCREDGTTYTGESRVERPNDLVAEWTDVSPVRTVTRQEIIPGTYDGVRVGDVEGGYVTIPGLTQTAWSADELTRAAAVLTALAGALRDGE